MLRAIADYKNGNISFPKLVRSLEEGFEAGDFRDTSLVKHFYDLWQPLEITNAVKGIHAADHEVSRDIQTMEDFLIEYLVERDQEGTIGH